jgi:hypothetical protein
MVKLSQRKGGVFTEEGRGFHRGREGFSQRKGGIITEEGRNYQRGREGFSQREDCSLPLISLKGCRMRRAWYTPKRSGGGYGSEADPVAAGTNDEASAYDDSP